MGKPIAGRDKFPFGIDGIQVEAVKTPNGIIKNVFISKQRSSNVFDLITKDGELIEFVEIANLPVLEGAVNSDELEDNTFIILGKDENGDVVGCVEKIYNNVVKLFNGEVLPFSALQIGEIDDNISEPEVPEEPSNPIIREEWETSVNTLPNEKALKENGDLKLGTGIKGTYATVANDGVIELALIPMIPGRKALGPAGSDGNFIKTEKGDISCFFGVTSLKHQLTDVFGIYDSITLDVINDGEIVQKMKLQEDGWYDKNGEMLEGTYIDEYTIQEATRVSFYTEKGKENKFILSANTKEDTVSIEVTVVDEYVELEVPESEPIPNTVEPEGEKPPAPKKAAKKKAPEQDSE